MGLVQRPGWLLATPPPTTRNQASADTEGASTPTAVHGVVGGPKLARAIVLATLCSYAAVQVIDELTAPFHSRGQALAVGLPSLAVLFLLMVSVSSAGAKRWPLWRRRAMLVAVLLTTYLPMIILSNVWGGMAGFAAGASLLLLSGWAAWALFGAVIGSMLPLPLLTHVGPYYTAYLVLSTLVLGLVIFGMARLSQLIRYVHAARAELAQVAVMRERVRFGRDLHDLLGLSLSAITLKAELVRRLVDGDPSRAKDELAELIDIARQAVVDTRIVASGYRNISLSKEASLVAALLATVSIDAHVENTCGALDETVDTVMATVLREAVTNILRHSTAHTCTIKANQVGETIRLQVVNDGVLESAVPNGQHRGLENLTTRLEAIGGRISLGVHDGQFELLAEAPNPEMAGLGASDVPFTA
jgi:two-component system, NarL family, sensor histidine kinase DesK